MDTKARVRQMMESELYKSYLAISAALGVDAVTVRRLFREIQFEIEAEDYSWLVE